MNNRHRKSSLPSNRQKKMFRYSLNCNIEVRLKTDKTVIDSKMIRQKH